MGCRRAHQHSEDEDDAARRDREGDGPLAERQVKRLAALRSRFLPVVLQFGSRSRTHRGTMGRQALTFGFACRFGFPSAPRSEEHTSELQSLMRISYAVFCLTKNNINNYISQT